ncbi:MAG: bifunctional oligoribonuclease/PAP phosphatase NrnA [Haloarculaceae archaeon]
MRTRVAGGSGVLTQVDAASRADAVASVVREEPLLAALVAVALVVGLVALAWGIRRLRRTKSDRLVDTLAGEREVAVLMHPNPDPDAMASALGVAELADSVGVESTIQYAGEIRHQENRAFETVLDLDFERIENAGDLASDAVVLVDHNRPRGFSGSTTVDPLAVVDHHPGDGTGTGFTDVRSAYGSCASILAEYFEELGWAPVSPDADVGELEDDQLSSTVATGLVYGIHSDTNTLTRGCSEAEFAASAYLYPGVDEDRLERIANPQADAEVLDVKARAIVERDVRNPYAVSDVGTVSNTDAIPQAADELIRLEGVTAVVVVGCKDDTLRLSGRSRDDRVHMGKTLEAVVDDIPMANAGGHARMGGGQLSLDHMEGIGPGDGVDRAEFRELIFDAMSGNA